MDAPIRPASHFGLLDEMHSSFSSLQNYALETLTSDDKIGYQGKLEDGNVTFHISGKGVIDFSRYSSSLAYASQVFSRFTGGQSTADTVTFLDFFKNHYISKLNLLEKIVGDHPLLGSQEIKELIEKIIKVKNSLDYFHQVNLIISDRTLPLNESESIDLNSFAESIRKKSSLSEAGTALTNKVTTKLDKVAKKIFKKFVVFQIRNFQEFQTTNLTFDGVAIINSNSIPHFFLNQLREIKFENDKPILDITYTMDIVSQKSLLRDFPEMPKENRPTGEEEDDNFIDFLIKNLPSDDPTSIEAISDENQNNFIEYREKALEDEKKIEAETKRTKDFWRSFLMTADLSPQIRNLYLQELEAVSACNLNDFRFSSAK